MENNEKKFVISELLECIGHSIDLDSDDSDKEDILIGLIDLCYKATRLPKRKRRMMWIKSWRINRKQSGSFSFLTKELLMTDELSYTNYLRLSKTQFQFLLTLMEQELQRSNTVFRDAIAPAEKLALTLRFLASGETFQSLDYQTRLSKSSISNIIPEVCELICKKLKSHLKFPTSQLEWEDIAREFAIKWQFPNCLGALDGKHINFRPLRADGAFFHNYKGTNSIILLALVNANYRFIFVDIGSNGRNNDAGVFLQSKLSTILNSNKIPPNCNVGNNRCLPYVVIADDAFPMQKHLMKPYPFHTNSNEKQLYNARLSRARQVVEHAFGMLSNRFRIFLAPINLKVETVETITLTCCTLHNFLGEIDETFTDSTPSHSTPQIKSEKDNAYNPRRGEAEIIRQQFMDYFNKEGKLDWM